MSKKKWNAFVEGQNTGICVFAICYGKSAPGQLAPDGRKLPTAFGMLDEALKMVLQGDWTSRKAGKLIQIVLADPADLARIQRMFRVGPAAQALVKQPCRSAHQFVYEPTDYRRLMQRLGYTRPA